MTAEATLERTENGTTVKADGWFALHATEAAWRSNERFGVLCSFEGEARYPQLGINLRVLQPGQPASLYHQETCQEDFYVVAGECILLVEEQERRLRAGHFVHCPAGTRHAFIGAGDGPCAILMVGARSGDKKLLYPVSEAAARHRASVESETSEPRQAYGKTPVYDVPAEPVWPLAGSD